MLHPSGRHEDRCAHTFVVEADGDGRLTGYVPSFAWTYDAGRAVAERRTDLVAHRKKGRRKSLATRAHRCLQGHPFSFLT